jgi:hypothetical protein
MNSLKTLKTNWRDLLAFVVLGMGLASTGGVIDYVSTYFGDNAFLHLVLPSLSNYLQGFSKFVGAAVAASTVYLMTWPTVSEFGNHSFKEAWSTLTIQQKLFTYVGLISVSLVAAAICFS